MDLRKIGVFLILTGIVCCVVSFAISTSDEDVAIKNTYVGAAGCVASCVGFTQPSCADTTCNPLNPMLNSDGTYYCLGSQTVFSLTPASCIGPQTATACEIFGDRICATVQTCQPRRVGAQVLCIGYPVGGTSVTTHGCADW